MTVQALDSRGAPAKRFWVSALVAALCVGAAGCGEAYKKQFNAAFDKSTHDSCVTSAVAHQAAPDAAEKYCSCIVTQLQGLSVAEKQSLSPTSDKANQAVAHCRAQVQ